MQSKNESYYLCIKQDDNSGFILHFITYTYSRFQLRVNLQCCVHNLDCTISWAHALRTNSLFVFIAQKFSNPLYSKSPLLWDYSEMSYWFSRTLWGHAGFGHSEVSLRWSNKTCAEPTLLLVVGIRYGHAGTQYTKAHIPVHTSLVHWQMNHSSQSLVRLFEGHWGSSPD